MGRINTFLYVATGLTFSGTIIYSIVQDQEKIKKAAELELAKKEILRLQKELVNVEDKLVNVEDQKLYIGLVSSIGIGLAIVTPAVLKSMCLR